MNPDAVEMKKVEYAGLPNCIQLSNGEIELIATTDIGPRIIRWAFVGGKNIFKEFPDHLANPSGDKWKNYGGHRFWHAPEVSPRTYAPDNSPIEHKWNGKTLKLIQPVEATTGLQKEIEVTLDAKQNRVTVLHRLTNRNLWEIETAPWALSVMQGPGRAIFPQEPVVNQFLPVRPLALWGYTDMQDPRYIWGTKYIQVKCDPTADKPQKIGVMNTLGWAAYLRGPDVFIKRFGFDAKATYPDFNCNTECYTRADMIEIESLGPLQKMAPGAKVEHVETWFLFKGKISESENALDKNLLPLVGQTSLSK